jgi:hypothetical protein
MGIEKNTPHSMGIEKNTPLWGVSYFLPHNIRSVWQPAKSGAKKERRFWLFGFMVLLCHLRL